MYGYFCKCLGRHVITCQCVTITSNHRYINMFLNMREIISYSQWKSELYVKKSAK